MATRLSGMRSALEAAVENVERVTSDRPDDGLSEFAVWTENDVANNRIVVTKIEPYSPRRRIPPGAAGIIRAKDELDVYRFIESYNRDRDYYK